jgi:anti-anti-sigma factor
VIDQVEVSYPRPDACVIALRGEHDIATAPAMEKLFREALALNDVVVVDVSDADFIDSSVVSNLFAADRHAKKEGKELRLLMGTAPLVRTLLEVSGVLDVLEVATNRDVAMRLER